MTNSKHTKRALLASVLSVVLCAAMLVGTTFAWFTDSVTSKGNIIASGTLDVAMEWADGTESLETENWKDASKDAIFNYKLWEPGYTVARHIRVTNNGTLALKYQLQIAATGVVGKLAEVIDVYAFDNGKQITNRDDVENGKNLGTLADVLDGNTETPYENHLSADDSHTVTIALKMQETAGNEYQGQSIGSDFAIKLLATQYTEETDSFDNQYDKEAVYPWDGTTTEPVEPNAEGEYEIATAENLAWISEEINSGTSFANKTIKLTKDVDLNHKNWTPINASKGQLRNAVIDGDGHVIRNLNVSDGYTVASGNTKYGSAFIGNITTPITIKNLTFDNATVDNENQYNVVGVILGYTYGTTVFDDVHVTNSDINGFGKVGVFLGMGADPGVSVTFRNCTSVNNTINAAYDAGGLAGNIQRKNGVDSTVIENCTVEGNTFKPYKSESAYKDLKGETAAFTENDLKDGIQASRPLYGKYWYDNTYLWAAWGEYYCSFGSSSYDPAVTVDGKVYPVANSSICVNSVEDIPGVD